MDAIVPEGQQGGSKIGHRSRYRFLLYLPAIFLAVLFVQPHAGLRQVDVPQFHAVGHLVRAGHIARLYDQDAYRQLNLPAMGYNRPAFYALALLPFGFMDYQMFLRVVRLASYILFGLGVWLIPRWFPLPHARALLVAFQPFLWSIVLGQDTILLTLIVGFGLHLMLHRGKGLEGGAVMALAVFKPHIVWAIPLALAAQRQWRALAGFMAVGGFLALLSFALVGARGIEQWIIVLQAPTTDASLEYMGNIRQIAAQFGMPAAVALGLITVTSFALCLRRSLPAAIAAALFVGPMLVPHSYLQDYSPAALSALMTPHPVMAYAVLTPWPMFVPGLASGVPYFLTGCAFLAVTAFWPVVWRRVKGSRFNASRQAAGIATGFAGAMQGNVGYTPASGAVLRGESRRVRRRT